MYETENDIPEQRRSGLNALMNQRLADAVDLQMQMKQAHWNVKGPQFIGLHELFDQIDEAVEVTWIWSRNALFNSAALRRALRAWRRSAMATLTISPRWWHSSDASYITGSNLTVDGGMNA